MRKLVLIVLCILSLNACSVEQRSRNDIKSETDILFYENLIKVDGFNNLINLLEESDYKKFEILNTSDSILRGKFTQIELDKQVYLQIYEYDDADLLYEDVKSIDDDGYSISLNHDDGTVTSTHYSWISTPNFFLYDNLIILYVGADLNIIELIGNQAEYVITDYKSSK